MILYLLRHGTPVGGRMYRGNLLDDPLTEEGWDQMKSSVTNLSFDTIATSPMKRCSEFADYISKKSKIPYSIIEDFRNWIWRLAGKNLSPNWRRGCQKI